MIRIILFLSLTFNLLFSITLVPLTKTLSDKKDKNIIFKVTNPTSEPVAVDISVLKVISTDNNKEKREKTDKISYYPSQFVLIPKETKNVRVKYMGSGLPDIEEVYRVIAKELDIDVTDKKEEVSTGVLKAKIKLRFTYEGLLFVHKPTTKPILSISFKELQSVGTERAISVTISNSGTSSIVPNQGAYNYLVTIKGKEYLLQDEDMKNAEFRRVLAGKTNTFYLKHIVNLPQGKIDSIRLEKK